MGRQSILILMVLFGSCMPVSAQVRWAAEYNLGLPVNVPGPLTIRQNGTQPVRMVAVWSARSFRLPLNWMWRIERWNNGRAWSLETVHHKMVLQNPPDFVQWLSITHGFNTVTVNRAWELNKIIFRTGAGLVLAHPESTINGIYYNDATGFLKLGYHLTGPVFMTSVARPVRIGKSFLINLEGKISAGNARIPVVDGSARLLHLAFHLHAGLGFSVRGRSPASRQNRVILPRTEV